ncbi:histidine kinase [Sphingobacterium sp. lm-10]|uniref:sensor histidine kinase n=1 Tax=Sphingobacterium sp. lm-10 TaxID=2944904 RepID=UPI0020229A04|nr:histidine kinase [Sphingobacterium sp. lm-10]MCL7986711.1 histidine kinase [Sphingobacterium sp. lm-10]
MKNIFERKWTQEVGILLFSFILFTLNDWILIATWKSLFLGTIYFSFLYAHAQFNRYYILPILLKKHNPYLFIFLTLLALAIFALGLNYLAHSVLYNNCFLHKDQSKLNYQYQIGVLLGSYICIIGTTKIFEYYRQQKDADSKELLSRKNQIDLLNKQLNPHFLFNTLNTIYGLSIKYPEKTPEAIMKISDLLRYQVENSNKDLVSLEEEISFIQSYIEIEKERVGYRCKIEFDYQIDEPHHRYIAPMIVFTFVENAFKHGTSNIEKCFIKIDLNVRNGILTLRISNSLPSKNNGRLSTKMGLENTKARLKMIYPGTHLIKVEPAEHAFETFLEITL